MTRSTPRPALHGCAALAPMAQHHFDVQAVRVVDRALALGDAHNGRATLLDQGFRDVIANIAEPLDDDAFPPDPCTETDGVHPDRVCHTFAYAKKDPETGRLTTAGNAMQGEGFPVTQPYESGAVGLRVW